ncbi:MAG: lysophospholipid acyltransferase family protein, partial [bacterium]
LVGGDQRLARKEALAACRNIAQYFVDLCTIPERMMERFEADYLELEGSERLAALKEPGPVIAMSAHSGNAELAIQALTFRGRPFVALVEAQRPRAWSRYMLHLRSSAGGTFYETSFQGIRACLETLHEGGLVGFMGDRDIQGNGLCIELADRHVRLPRGPWEIARRSRALVLPVFTARIHRDRFRLFVEEPFRVAQTGDEEADILAAVTRFASLLENHLRRDPGQWAFTEDFWGVHACGQG